MAADNWMIYGANGYTGALLAEEAVRRGRRPILAGRSAGKIRPLAERLGLDWLAFDLEDTTALHDAVRRVGAVMHAAGPFARTSAPMVAACLAESVHYLDITGEIRVFEDIFSHDRQAQERGIALVPGVGFDVVPTDCLAGYVAGQVPDATELEVAVHTISRSSPGTAKTALEGQVRSGYIRRNGELRPCPLGQGARRIRFPAGERLAAPIPWGDLVTAYRSTGIPNITTYMTFSPSIIRLMPWAAPILRLSRFGFVRQAAQSLIAHTVKGPDAALRERGRSYFWARAANADGRSAEAWLTTVEGYRFTAMAGVLAVEKVLAGGLRGAMTPAQAFGADFALEIAGSIRQDSL